VLTFPAGQVMKDHAAPKTILLQALDGHLRVTADGDVTDLLPGGVIRIEKLIRHQVEAVAESRLMLTLVG
jgi:quercetin dioxygenase-like cupin family protein